MLGSAVGLCVQVKVRSAASTMVNPINGLCPLLAYPRRLNTAPFFITKPAY